MNRNRNENRLVNERGIEQESRPKRALGSGILIGTVLGMILSIAIRNLAVGMPIGIILGVVFGTAAQKRKDREHSL
ncbi:hypothetical protein [Saccharibacillus sacchari]|uniref:Uncharacterized protein n=1 Tax=Saccharibacillus sacchari TaxID=456493 RepID=A0ACC6PBX8_9BACL